MEKLQLVYSYYYWLDPWERYPELPQYLLEYVVENDITDIETLKQEYLEQFE